MKWEKFCQQSIVWNFSIHRSLNLSACRPKIHRAIHRAREEREREGYIIHFCLSFIFSLCLLFFFRFTLLLHTYCFVNVNIFATDFRTKAKSHSDNGFSRWLFLHISPFRPFQIVVFHLKRGFSILAIVCGHFFV